MPLETARLILRELTEDDAEFCVELLNQASFLQFIGDRGVRDVDGARAYLRAGPLASYRLNGFGLYGVEYRQEPGRLMGFCGLVRREGLDDVDLGYAFLPYYWHRGYALEAARAVLKHARAELGLHRVVAIVAPDNAASIRVLDKLGFVFERELRLPGSDQLVQLFGNAD